MPEIHSIIHKKLNKLTGGVEAFLSGDGYLKLTSSGFMDLTIERIAPDTISMTHYGLQNGDLMSDPDMTIKINQELKTATALTFRNDYIGVDVSIYDGKKINPTLSKELNTFLAQWLKNLKEQGFYR